MVEYLCYLYSPSQDLPKNIKYLHIFLLQKKMTDDLQSL